MTRLLLGVLLALSIRAGAAEPARAVPQPVAELLTATAAATPAEVIRLVDAWKGDLHPLLSLARGQARWHLALEAQAGDRSKLLAGAEQDFRAALAVDEGLRQAHLGLAQCAAAHDDWRTASRAAAAGIDPATADRSLLAFLANAALRASDWRLATLTTQHGIMRFPDDPTLRRIELAVLVQAGRGEDARQAVLSLLAQDPGDVQLWKHLAWSAQETHREDEALAALEAALALTPDDRNLRTQLAQVQLGHGLPQAALATVRPLVGEPPQAQALGDDALVLLASRIAADAGEIAQARTWLMAVPEAQRSRAQRIQMARLAVQAGDRIAAGAALDVLVETGESDTGVLTWAASLAEERGEHARAEMLYLRAVASEGAQTAGAALRLVGLYLTQNRRDEARVVLATYLARKPDDVQALALQSQINQRKR